jgi:hypothetical protein
LIPSINKEKRNVRLIDKDKKTDNHLTDRAIEIEPMIDPNNKGYKHIHSIA